MKTRFKKFVNGLFCHVLYRVKFEGQENVDMSRSNVLVANHVSAMDAIFIWSNLDNMAMMAKAELFRFKLVAKFLKAQGAFPIERGKKDYRHVYHAVKVVDGSEPRNLLIFPEGTRNARRKGVKAKNGATYIAATTGTVMVPIHITERIRLFGKVTVKYGKPIELNISKENIKDKNILTENTERIMKTIYSMGDNSVR